MLNKLAQKIIMMQKLQKLS